MARLVHFSDTHLGHQQYTRTDADGLNQREVDLYAAFQAIIDHAVATRPDAVIHAGDLFDGVRPSNRALHEAMKGFLKLSQAGIPTVIIAGNHEHPKLRETGSPLRLFEHLPHIHPVYRGQRETIEVATRDGLLRIHAVPQCSDNATLAAEVATITASSTGQDVLVLHGAVSTLKAFAHAEFNELSLDPSWFDHRFHYVALGHYHGVQQVTPKAWYCGAPDRVSMAEAGQEKGFLEVSLAPTGLGVQFHGLPVRPYVDLVPIDADGLAAEAVVAAARTPVQRAGAGAVVRQRIRNLDPNLKGNLDLKPVFEAGRHVLHLDLTKLEWKDNSHQVRSVAELGPLPQELSQFAGQVPMEGGDRAKVMALAQEILGLALRRDEAP